MARGSSPPSPPAVPGAVIISTADRRRRCWPARWRGWPVAAWMRPRVPLVAGEVPSPLQRLLIAADSASGLAVVLDHTRYTFVNADLTVAVHRRLEGEWLCLDAATVAEAHGIGLTRARLWDGHGPLGVSLQTCLVERRPG